MKKPSLLKMVCVVLLLCTATAIASPAQVLTTLHSFAGGDGASPLFAGLVQATDGNFYGTTVAGGAYNSGTVFKISFSGTLTTLHSFNGADGAASYAGLVQATDGNFYGTTIAGGASNTGTVFKITPSGTLTTLYSFCSQANCADGTNPRAGLVQATDGNFYGTTFGGGANDEGTVFKITPSGGLTTLYSFCGQANCADGQYPLAGLIQATDGNFYGTTWYGGANDEGTIFKITPSGALTTLHSFGYLDGGYPYAGLIQATDGNFYGTTFQGGAGNCGCGTVFKITASGTLTTLHSFDYTDGGYPDAGLIQATDGNFYGTAFQGGAGNCGCGTVFKITASGTLTTLHSFDNSDGSFPYAALVQATDGNFYGTTTLGGAYGDGTVFRLVLLRACIVCRATE